MARAAKDRTPTERPLERNREWIWRPRRVRRPRRGVPAPTPKQKELNDGGKRE